MTDALNWRIVEVVEDPQQKPAPRQSAFVTFFTRPLSRNEVLISLGVHLLFGVLAVFVVAIRVSYKPQSVFVGEAAVTPALEPRKLEMKVRVQDMQKRSARPRPQPRIAVAAPAKIALPEIKKLPEPAQAKMMRTFSTQGISGQGRGIGGGLGDGVGEGVGQSSVSFFGIRENGHQLCIIVDVSLSMCEDSRGGLPGFQRVKEALKDVLYQVSDGTLFNVIAFENSVSACWPKMVRVSPESKREVGEWIMRYNELEGPYGLGGGNYRVKAASPNAAGGTSRLDLALTAAFEIGAGVIFVITDGVPVIQKPFDQEAGQYVEVSYGGHEVTDREIRDWEKAMEEWQKEEDKRIRKGLGPRVAEGGAGPPPRPTSHSGGNSRNPVFNYWTDADTLDHINDLQERFYISRGKQRARIHCVGYEADDETRRFLRKLARKNQGRYKRVRGLR